MERFTRTKRCETAIENCISFSENLGSHLGSAVPGPMFRKDHISPRLVPCRKCCRLTAERPGRIRRIPIASLFPF